jgi:hypothetical protein
MECNTCPWKSGNKRNRWWLIAHKKLTDIGILKSGIHRCHEKSKDLCGKPDKSNVCKGSLKLKKDVYRYIK